MKDFLYIVIEFQILKLYQNNQWLEVNDEKGAKINTKYHKQHICFLA